MISALIFDFDGTILDTEFAEFHAVREVFEQHDALLDRNRWQRVVGTDAAHGFWFPWLQEQSERVGFDAVVADARARKYDLISELQPLPGVITLLDAAGRADVPLAIASSSPQSWVAPHLERLGLRDRFAVVRCRDHVANAKPSPDLYTAACDAIGANPRESVAIEDSRNGVLAAKAAGLRCVVCPNSTTEGMDMSAADLLVHSLVDVTLERLADLVG